jgi:hypothetical protein
MKYNPTVSIGAEIEVPEPPNWSRKTYTRVQYSSLSSFIYNGDDLKLSNVGGTMYLDTLFMYSLMEMGTSVGLEKPSFISDEDWQSMESGTSSTIITPQKSIMPRPLVPTQLVVSNGWYRGANRQGSATGVFNWVLESGSENAVNNQTYQDEAECIFVGNNGTNFINKISVSDQNGLPPALSDVDVSNMVGGGAFQIGFRIIKRDGDGISIQEATKYNESEGTYETGTGTEDGMAKANAKVKIEIGKLSILVNGEGDCIATCGGPSYSITLKRSMSERVMPQAKSTQGPEIIISVIPCWNGVVIQSGIQDGEEMSTKSGAFVPYKAGEGLFAHCPEIDISSGGGGIPVKNIKTYFDIRNPTALKIKTDKVKVDLGAPGDFLYVTAENCSIICAYVPLFFPPKSKFIHAIRGNLPVSQYVYNYRIFPIWTENATSSNLSYSDLFEQTGFGAFFGDTSIFKAEFLLNISGNSYTRNAPEVFGSIIEMEEIVSSVYVNKKGTQTLASKSDFIRKVTVSNSLGSNTGSILLDWWGISKNAPYVKEVGAIDITVNGWQDMPSKMPNSAKLFTGYTWEASENKSKNGYDVNISLVGLGQRLDDVHLITPPIFDGYFFSQVVEYICKACGVSYDISQANNPRLCMTTDINSVIYNLTTGIACKAALEMICKDCANRYFYTNDGKLMFYAVNTDGTPKYGLSKTFSFDGLEIDQNDMAPSFDNIRNYVVLIAMKKTKDMTGKDFPDGWIPIPITSIRKSETTPVIPWQRAICYTLNGFLEVEEVDLIADTLERSSKKYELLGSVTVPGIGIQPLDKVSISDSWGNQLYWVVSVNQNVDLESKSWTTSLELMM